MIITEFYNGQGLGNQLWCYVVTRLIAGKNGYEFGIMSPEKFKGREFMNLDFGKKVVGGYGPEGGSPYVLPETIENYYKESSIIHHSSGLDISTIDLNMLDVQDNTKLDGTMQSTKYLNGHKNKIIDMLKIHDDKKILDYSDDNTCIIHFRGGDFKNSSAMLYSRYYQNAIEIMKNKNKNIVFYVVTDDFVTASQVLPNVKIIGGSSIGIEDTNKATHHIGGPIWIDYSILNNAKNIIMSASSFGWWPIWTNQNNPYVIAPKYWAAHKLNAGYWSCGDSLVDGWDYIDVNGVVMNYEKCLEELR